MKVLIQVTTKDGELRQAIVEGDWHKGLGEGSFIREALVPGLKAVHLVDEDCLSYQATVMEDLPPAVTVYSDHISIDGATHEDGAHFTYAFDVIAPKGMVGDGPRHVLTDAMVRGGALRIGRRD